MRSWTMVLAAALALGGEAVTAAPAHAGCGGYGGSVGGYGVGAGRAFAQTYQGYSGGYGYAGGYGCGGGSGCGMMMGGMGMSGMAMGTMPMPTGQAAVASMPGMNMSGAAAAAPAAAPGAPVSSNATYYCSMHPNVMSTFPAVCPYCQMALQKK